MEEKYSDEKIYKEQVVNNINILPGDQIRSPDESFYPTIIFIDAGFLEKLSKFFGKESYLKFDRKTFAENICNKERLKCEKIFYYTTPPFHSEKPSEEEEKRKKGYDRFIKKLREKGVIIREGRCQRLKIDNRYEYNQKAVDILMTIDLMNIPLKYPYIKRVILISSDSDFVPVINNFKEIGIKTVLYTFYRKGRNIEFSRSNYLIKSVHKYKLLTKKDFNNAPLK